MSFEVTMDSEQLLVPQQQLNPSSPSRLSPRHTHWDPGGVRSTTSPAAGNVTIFTFCLPGEKGGVASSSMPASDPAEVPKGVMGQMGREGNGSEENIVLTPDKDLVGVPSGGQGPIGKDLSGLEVTMTTQVNNDQGHLLAPSVNILDKAQGPIGAHGPAKLSDSTPPLSDPRDDSEEVAFSSPAMFMGSEEAVMPQHFFTTKLEDASFLSGMEPCVRSKMLSKGDAFVMGMPPLRSVCECVLYLLRCM